MIHRSLFVVVLAVGLLLPSQSYAKEQKIDWLTFLSITALATGTTVGLTYVGGKYVLQHVARQAGEDIGKELEKKFKELKEDAEGIQYQAKYGHLVREKSITLADYINPPKQIFTLLHQLKNQDRYEKMGIVIPRGILLVGDPGTGKTHLARALAGESDCPFFEYSATEFSECRVGDTPKAIRTAFTEARDYARAKGKKAAFLFIDEFDAIGMRNDDHISSRESVNTFLTCMDGFAQQEPPVIVLAATNNLDKIDDALKRKGRFDFNINIPYPNLDTRQKLFSYRMRKTKIDPMIVDGLDKKLARITHGWSHAEVVALVNGAAQLAVEHGVDRTGVNYDNFARALWYAKEEKRAQQFPSRSTKEKLWKQFDFARNISAEEFLTNTENMTLQDLEGILKNIGDQKRDCNRSDAVRISLAEKKRELMLRKNKDVMEICEELYPSAAKITENELMSKTPEEIFETNLKKYKKT